MANHREPWRMRALRLREVLARTLAYAHSRALDLEDRAEVLEGLARAGLARAANVTPEQLAQAHKDARRAREAIRRAERYLVEWGD